MITIFTSVTLVSEYWKQLYRQIICINYFDK